MDLELRRRFFAEELQAVCNFRSPGLLDAFAAVPRERFLSPGPWTVLGDAGDGMAMMGGAPRHRTTPDADPAHVYHNVAIAIDPARQLFNGQPGTLAVYLDLLDLAPGKRVLHVGSGLGYYTAVMAQAVGAAGRVLTFEVDESLAAGARENLASMPWVDVRHGDATGPLDGVFDAMLVNAGVTHPLDTWLDALAPGGRLILPLTGTMPHTPPQRGSRAGGPGMGSPIGKGVTWLLTKQDDGNLSVRPIGIVAIYSAIGLRDGTLNTQVGKALMGGPMQWAAVTHLRRDPHEPSSSCWLHGPTWCWSTQ
jgi:protein-L-isoaspartate(D-aspartate) O-methyltransferase